MEILQANSNRFELSGGSFKADFFRVSVFTILKWRLKLFLNQDIEKCSLPQEFFAGPRIVRSKASPPFRRATSGAQIPGPAPTMGVLKSFQGFCRIHSC